jgi:trans-aconitate 2-methyltransferase
VVPLILLLILPAFERKTPPRRRLLTAISNGDGGIANDRYGRLVLPCHPAGMGSYQWNAADYARHSAGQEQWARELIGRAGLVPDDRVLDIGCGDGRITAAIAKLVPDGAVLGIDLSADMVQHAIGHFPARDYPNLGFEQADARALPFDGGFTFVFSNAVLHWIRDQRPVVAGIARALAPGGRCLLQMGGRGNAADVIRVFDSVSGEPAWRHWYEGFESSYGFHGDDDYRGWLADAGLVADHVALIEKDMVHADRDAFIGWLRTAWHPYTSPVPEAVRPALIEIVADRYLEAHPRDAEGRVHVMAIRLQVEARRGVKP